MGLLRNVTGSRTLRAATGQQMEVQTVQGTSVYSNSDGFSVVSNLERVDEFTVQTPSDSVLSKNHAISGHNTMVTKAYSMGTGDAGNEGQEIKDGTDLSGDEYVFTAYKL